MAAIALAALVAGCFGPEIVCGREGGCPSGQLCDLGDRVCRPAAECTDCPRPFALAAEQGSPASDADDEFGYAVAGSDDAFTVGAWGEAQTGAAYLYHRDGTTWQSTRQTAPDSAPGDEYGASVAVTAAYLVAGAPAADLNGADSGGVYIYRRSGLNLEPDISIPGAADADRYGCAVAVAGTALAVGACRADGDGVSDCGAVSLYENRDDNWSSFGTFNASDPQQGQRFGSALAVDGGVAAVGASGDGQRGGDAGAVYLFEKQPDGAWMEVAKILASDGQPGDLFGHSVAISGATLAVGAYRDDDLGNNAGAVYLFERGESGWTETVKLTAGSGGPLDLFGFSVALAGDVLFAGARWTDEGGEDAGSVYVFERVAGGWVELGEIVAPPAAVAGFGFAVTRAGDALVAAAYPEQAGGNSGAAYVFERAAP